MSHDPDLWDDPLPPRAPDPWPGVRATYPDRPIARRIFVNAEQQEWVLLEGDLAALYDGATMFVYTPARSEPTTVAERAEIVERFNSLQDTRQPIELRA